MTNPYALHKNEKHSFLVKELRSLTAHHYAGCEPYRSMLGKSGISVDFDSIEDAPFFPVQLFKLMDLKSVKSEEVFKVLTSSGTSGQQVSKIFLDKETAVSQTKSLVSLMKPLLGTKRLPMIILDTKSVLKDRKSFSARGAGMLGFSNFGRQHFYAFHDDMQVDWEGVTDFLNQHRGEKILLFGFTFMIWKHFYQEAVKRGIRLDLGEGVLIHGGGWKKLEEEAVSNEQFKTALFDQFGIKDIHNYYGMVEQVGSIFVECSKGHLHTPMFADILIRDPITFELIPFGEQGLIQVVSMLPKSYPGHSLLTEDLGTIHGEDDCPCGWVGKYFSVAGRIPKAELRGCSDTFAYDQKGGS